MPIGNDKTDRTEFLEPTEVGWYGTISGDGEGEVWVGAAYWDGAKWFGDVGLAYARSARPFETKEDAWNKWAHVQPD